MFVSLFTIVFGSAFIFAYYRYGSQIAKREKRVGKFKDVFKIFFRLLAKSSIKILEKSNCAPNSINRDFIQYNTVYN